MTAERLFNTLGIHLRAKTIAAGGVFAQSETVEQTLSLLSGSAGRFRVILQWQQEKPGSGRGVREMTVLVIVQMGGQNLAVNMGDLVSVQRPSSLSAITADAEMPTADSGTASFNNSSLLHRASQVCGWMLGIHFPTHDDVQQHWPVMEPGRYYWLSDPKIPTVQRAHEFTVTYAPDEVEAVPLTIG
jgi:hypothetical protein